MGLRTNLAPTVRISHRISRIFCQLGSATLVIIALLIPIHLLADPLDDSIAALPNPLKNENSFVLDQAGILGDRKPEIDSLCKALYAAGGAQIAVVTLQNLGDASIDEFAVRLFKTWGIGQKDKDNGVLLIHSTGDRKIRIEVGYGLEWALPDAKANWIIQEVGIPFFKNQDFASGHYYMVQSLLRAILNPEMGHDEIVAIRDTIKPGSRIDPAQLPDEDYITDLQSRREKNRIESGENHAGWITYTGMIASFCIFFWMFFRIVRLQLRLSKDVADPKERHDLMDDAILDFSAAGLFLPLGIVALEWAYASSFWSVLLIPVGVIGSWLLHDLALKSVRNVSRKCSECGKTMQKLGEAEDDAYLDAGQIAEEALGSVDYDVWICECGASEIVRFKEVSSQQKCPSCQYRTYTVAKTKILQKPTTESSGMGERTMKCSYCGFEAKNKYSIPKTEASSSDQNAAAGIGAAAAIHAALDSGPVSEEKPSSESFSHDDSQYEPSNSSDSNDSSSSDWDIPDDFGGGESGGGGASSDY